MSAVHRHPHTAGTSTRGMSGDRSREKLRPSRPGNAGMATQQSARMRVQALMVDEDVAGTTGDWVVFGANIWWYPICYSVLTVVLGFVGSTLQCRKCMGVQCPPQLLWR